MDEKIEPVVEEEIDGRTVLGKLQAKVIELEDNQKKIQVILEGHEKRIAECCVRR